MKTFFILAVVIALAAGNEIVNQDSDVYPDGSFHYRYESSDGSSQKVEGDAKGEVHGSYKYTDPEGVVVETVYEAGEQGFIPHGSHIPEVPLAIARALEWAAQHPYKGDK